MFETPERNHFSIIFERLGAVLAFFAVYFVNSIKNHGWEIFTLSYYKDLIFTASHGGGKSALVFAVIFIIVVWCLFISYRYWLKTSFFIDGTDFVYKRNTMFKIDSRLPVQNIAMVNVERSIFERLLGTAKVKIDLNSSRTANQTDFKFVLKRARANELKKALLSIKEEQLNSETDSENAREKEPMPRDFVVRFSAVEALRHKLLSFPIFQSIFTLMIIFVLPLLKTEGGTQLNRLWYLLFIAVAGAIGSMVMGTLNLGEYLVEQDSKMIYISCGILNKKNYSFEHEKINAVVINEPVFARLFGLCSISIAVVGFGNEKNETTHLSLMTDKKTAKEIIEKCAPGFACKGDMVRAHPFMLVPAMLRAVAAGGATMLLSIGYDKIMPIAIAVFVIMTIGALVEFDGKYFSFDDNVVYYTRGIFSRYHGVVKYGDIQEVTVKTNLLFKKYNLGRMKFSILSASSMQTHKTGWFSTEAFDAVARRVVDAEDNVLF